MTDANDAYLTKSGRRLTGADLDALADEVEHADYPVEQIKPRRGRPPLGSGPSEVVPVRLDPELREAVSARADADDTSTSEVIRRALRAFLEVA